MRFTPFHTNIIKLISQIISPKTYSHIINWPQYFTDYLGLIQNPYTVLLNNKLKLTLIPNNAVKFQIHEIILQDAYQLNKLKQKPPKTIIDLGANIGVFTLYAKKLFPKANIYSYEPQAHFYKFLQKNIKTNHSQKDIQSFPLACYSAQTVRRFKTKKPDFSDLTGPQWVYLFKNSITLENIFSQNKINTCDLLKIDVEAAEYDILYSLPDSYFRRIKRICLEYHSINKQNTLNGSRLNQFLQMKNFKVRQKKSPFADIGIIYASNNAFL